VRRVLSGWPDGRRVAFSAGFCLAVAVVIVTVAGGGLSQSFPVRLVQVLAIGTAAVAVIGAVIALITSRLADYRSPADEEEFERLVRRSERLARENLAAEPDEGEFLGYDPYDPEDFRTLVREALDDLPDLLIRALDHVAVVISDQGRRHGAYGLYHGDGVARDNHPDRIIIFRDTLLRDFGHDPDELRHQVTITVRHELAHHLGADELGVRELGL
jgi:predicted Zn-dependent protease with MMP-like domain